MKRVLTVILMFALAASTVVLANLPDVGMSVWTVLSLFFAVTANCFAGHFFPVNYSLLSKRLKVLASGCELIVVFCVSVAVQIVIYCFLLFGGLIGKVDPFMWGSRVVCALLVNTLLFANGIVRIYFTSEQLGVKYRVLGIALAYIPVANVIMLMVILKVAITEVLFENGRLVRNKDRELLKLCKTKYPILLVHGVFFRDSKLFNYWGRIPAELEKNGATVYYGNHSSALSVEDSAKELAKRIREIIEETGAEKLNVIAHSKGGLDMRTAIAKEGIADRVASLITVNTPHRGCEFADYLLNKMPDVMRQKLADTYNTALHAVGDPAPDFLAAVGSLTAKSCERLNSEIEMPEGIYCASVGSSLVKARGGRFPLNLTYDFVKYFDGINDGLVGESSFAFGESFDLLKPVKKRGISHADVIDLNRENIPGFDVREYYVGLVHGLKERGL